MLLGPRGLKAPRPKVLTYTPMWAHRALSYSEILGPVGPNVMAAFGPAGPCYLSGFPGPLGPV